MSIFYEKRIQQKIHWIAVDKPKKEQARNNKIAVEQGEKKRWNKLQNKWCTWKKKLTRIICIDEALNEC